MCFEKATEKISLYSWNTGECVGNQLLTPILEFDHVLYPGCMQCMQPRWKTPFCDPTECNLVCESLLFYSAPTFYQFYADFELFPSMSRSFDSSSASFASHSLGGVHLRRRVSLRDNIALRKIESKVSGVYGSLEFLRST